MHIAQSMWRTCCMESICCYSHTKTLLLRAHVHEESCQAPSPTDAITPAGHCAAALARACATSKACSRVKVPSRYAHAISPACNQARAVSSAR